MTTIALFGGTGKTGRRVLERALAAGYDVRALVRDPDKLGDPAGHPALTVMVGDVLDPVAVDETVAGADVVPPCSGR
ncbi:NAD(P)-dependent oxidoreductase [Agromyces sp. GXS1127]|uniref:NAD(P)-dependent oxidoreductase n=1 Tax=Agromyces sp. GXS1127 TaxID=3424181 RepID=UPI003D31036A